MQMTFRWYGDGNDDITPEMIRQIPGVGGLVWALHDKQPGEIWTVEEIEKVRARIEGAGFHMDVVSTSMTILRSVCPHGISILKIIRQH